MFRFGPIGDFLRWLLDLIYRVVPNYGWAILVFVCLIRLCLLPLDIRSRRGMKRMQDVQPQIDYIQKKYAQDKERLNQKMADLYKKEKISPLSGCLPMLIQLPILFAMFAVMREVTNEKTVDMILQIKAALEAGNLDFRPTFESFFWIRNIFQPDSFMSTVVPVFGDTLPGVGAFGVLTQEMIDEARAFLSTELYADWASAFGNSVIYGSPMLLWRISILQVFNGLFILPVLSAVTQFISSKFMNQNTASASEQQKSTNQLMKWFFPLFSLWICSSSNAGFALYWVAANVIQVLQQLVVNKWIDYSDAKKKTLTNEEAGKNEIH